MRNLRMTRHIRARIAQRSIRHQDLQVWERYVDREQAAPGGAVYLELSNTAADEALAAGVSSDQLRRHRRLRVVVADGAALTVYRVPSLRKSRPKFVPTERKDRA